MIAAVQPNKVFRKPSCPWGEKSVRLLAERDIAFEDHVFASEEEEHEFKRQQQVKTTPQTFINGERVGGYEELTKRLGIRERAQSIF